MKSESSVESRVGLALVVACVGTLLFGCGGGGGSGGQAKPGQDAYAGPGQMLKDFDAVYKPPNGMAGQSETQTAIGVKGKDATIYIKDNLLGTRWYKFTDKTLADLERAGGAPGPEADRSRVVVGFDGATVTSKETVYTRVGAKELAPANRDHKYKLDEADRVKE